MPVGEPVGETEKFMRKSGPDVFDFSGSKVQLKAYYYHDNGS
jgi:hypothetical protein